MEVRTYVHVSMSMLEYGLPYAQLCFWMDNGKVSIDIFYVSGTKPTSNSVPSGYHQATAEVV